MQNNISGKQVLVASAWPYANGSMHLGHIASLIGADVLARYHRLRGDRVLFVSGSDCYGTPIALEAIKCGVSPDSIANKYHTEFKETFKTLSFSFDLYTATTTDEHTKTVQDMFLQLHKKGYVYPKTADALYSPLLERFLPDRFIEGECPKCGEDGARGDQCDACGELLDPLSLRNPRVNADILPAGVSFADATLEVRPSEHFYLKLSAFQDKLEQFVAERGDAWRLNAAQFTKSFLKQGLHDRAITRDTDWGVPVPLPGYGDKRLYVWFDAVLGYVSASQHATPSWKQWWENPDALHYYVHGKDNIPFHTIILPAILIAHGNLHLPDRVFSSEYLSLEGQQFSTSRSWAVWVPDFLEHFDAELLRYFFTAQGPETSDVDFNWSEFGQLVNGELIGTFGNLVHRVCSFTVQHFPDGVSGKPESKSQPLCDAIDHAFESVGLHIEAGKFRRAFRDVLQVAEMGNRFAHTTEPWKTIADNPQQAQNDLLVLLHTIQSLAILVQPFLPETSRRIQQFFGSHTFSDAGLDNNPLCAWQVRSVPSHLKVSDVKPLFQKIEESEIQARRDALKPASDQ